MVTARTMLIHRLQKAAGWTVQDLMNATELSSGFMTNLRGGGGAGSDSLRRLAEAFTKRVPKPDLQRLGFSNNVVEATDLAYIESAREPIDELVAMLGADELPAEVLEVFGKSKKGESAVDCVYSLFQSSPEKWDQLTNRLSKVIGKKPSKTAQELLSVLDRARSQINTTSHVTTRSSDQLNPTGDSKAGEAKLPTREEAEKLRNDGVALLRPALIGVLKSDALRKFLIEKNNLATELTAEELVDKILAVTPQILRSGAHGTPSTPMSYLAKCRMPPLPDLAVRTEVLEGIRQLIGLLAPLSFVFHDMSQFAVLAQRAANVTHASASCTRPLIGASILALFLGKSIEVETPTLVKDNSSTGASFVESWNRVHTTDAAPILGSDERDLIKAIAVGLCPLIGAVDSKVTYVNASLQELDEQGTAVCIWFDRNMHEDDVQSVNRSFPLLFPLVCSAKDDEQTNATVVTQIDWLRRFIKENT